MDLCCASLIMMSLNLRKIKLLQAFQLFGVLMIIEVLRLFGGCEVLLSGSCSIAKQWSVYSVKDGTRYCRDCSECPSGLEVIPPCGSNISATTITGCLPCVKGKFSASKDIGPCKPCNICGENREVLKECKEDQDTECGGCIKGFYPTRTGDCLPCQSCCKSSEKHEKCVHDGVLGKHCMADSKCDLTIINELQKNSSNYTVGNSTSPHDREQKHTKPFLSTGLTIASVGGVALLVVALGLVFAYKMYQHRKIGQPCYNIIWQRQDINSVPPSTSCTTLAKQETRVELPDTSHEEQDSSTSSSLSMSGRPLSPETGEASGASIPEKELMLRGQDSQFIPVEESRKRY